MKTVATTEMGMMPEHTIYSGPHAKDDKTPYSENLYITGPPSRAADHWIAAELLAQPLSIDEPSGQRVLRIRPTLLTVRPVEVGETCHIYERPDLDLLSNALDAARHLVPGTARSRPAGFAQKVLDPWPTTLFPVMAVRSLTGSEVGFPDEAGVLFEHPDQDHAMCLSLRLTSFTRESLFTYVFVATAIEMYVQAIVKRLQEDTLPGPVTRAAFRSITGDLMAEVPAALRLQVDKAVASHPVVQARIVIA